MSMLYMFYSSGRIKKMKEPAYLSKIWNELKESNYTKSDTLSLLYKNDNIDIILINIYYKLLFDYNLGVYKYIKERYKDELLFSSIISRVDNLYNFVESCEYSYDLAFNQNMSKFFEKFSIFYNLSGDKIRPILFDQNNGNTLWFLSFLDKDGNDIVIEEVDFFATILGGEKDKTLIDKKIEAALQCFIDLLLVCDYSEKMKKARLIALSKLTELMNVNMLDENLNVVGQFLGFDFLDNFDKIDGNARILER